VFSWIYEKLEQIAPPGQSLTKQAELFRKEIQTNMKALVQIDAPATIELVDKVFNGTHLERVESMKAFPRVQLKYIKHMLAVKGPHIQGVIKKYGIEGVGAEEAKMYLQILLLHVRLCCQLKPEKVLPTVE